MADYYTLLTTVGLAKLTNAQALGQTVQFTHFAVGDGNGAVYNPAQGQTALAREVYRAPINQIYVDPNNPAWLVVEAVIPENVGGWYVREAGVFDVDGAMIAIAKYPETFKPALASGSGKDLYVRLILEYANTATVELKIDPAIVLSTRKYVDDSVATHAAGRSHPAATEAAQGMIELATAAEVQAGTDAVRAVTPAGLAALTATESRRGLVELATPQEVQDGADAQRAVVPAALASLTASDGRRGLIEIATNAEVQAGTDTSRAVTPAGLSSRTATEVRAGIVELATAVEAEAGTDTQRAVTPAGVKVAYGQYGLGGSVTFAGDLNTLTASGFYYASSDATNKPVGTNGHVIVSRIGQDANYVVQHCILGGITEPREFVRVRVAGTWGAWREIWVGDIAHSLSTNGYQRMPSGLIVQWGSVSAPFSTVWANQAITFPVSFTTVAANVTPVAMNGTDVDVSFMLVSSPSLTGATIRYKTDVAGASFSLRWTAIGY